MSRSKCGKCDKWDDLCDCPSDIDFNQFRKLEMPTMKPILKPQWFTTDKPLPDGDYGWRLDENSYRRPVKVYSGAIFQLVVDHHGEYAVYKDEDFSRGEWLKIEFPD